VTVSGSDHPFDHPVGAAVRADGTTAYILECGLECGGTTAAVTPLTLSNNLQGPSIPVPGATAALRNGNTLYVAGTPPGATCAALTAPCGFLSVIDLNTMTLLNTTPIEITDGRHDRIEVTEDGQVFIGSKGCTEVGGRGCLSIVKGAGFNVIIPPDTGDVTGIAPVPNRTAVYVVEGGELRIYDTTTDQLLVNHQLNIVGQLVDVKIVDKAP
jgi:DNA-binding beta-propeller fold protein YncE